MGRDVVGAWWGGVWNGVDVRACSDGEWRKIEMSP